MAAASLVGRIRRVAATGMPHRLSAWPGTTQSPGSRARPCGERTALTGHVEVNHVEKPQPPRRVAADLPNARFEHAGGYKTASNLATYDARYYEARWLTGWLAGRTSRSGVAGYVAGFPVPEVVQGINAFALGMRAANAKATVRVVWLDTWFDPAKERDAAQTL